MDTFELKEDMPLVCLKAESFPDKVKEAHEKLHGMVSHKKGREFFGLGWKVGEDEVLYKSAANELKPGELNHLKLENMLLEKGKYVYIDVKDFMANIPAIGQAIERLMQDPRTDEKGVFVEWYTTNSNCRCMAKIKP